MVDVAKLEVTKSLSKIDFTEKNHITFSSTMNVELENRIQLIKDDHNVIIL